MVNPSAHNIVVVQRHVGVPYRMGVNGAHNIVGEMSAPTTLFVLGKLQSTVSTGVQGMFPVSWFDSRALPCFLRLFPGPFRVSVPVRLVLVGSDCASWRRTVSRCLAYPPVGGRGIGVGSGAFGQAFQSERPSGGGLETEVHALVREVGRSR